MSTARPAARLIWYGAIALIFIGALWVPLYNRIEPRVFGIPFFYWFQFVWIIVTAVATALAYRAKL